jgi:hypothetical protein
VTAAYERMHFSGAPYQKIYEILDASAKSGAVFCPYPRPKDGYWDGKRRKVLALDEHQRNLLNKWLNDPRALVQLEAAYCLVQAGKIDPRIESIKEIGLANFQPGSAENSAALRIESEIRSIRKLNAKNRVKVDLL